MRALHLPTALLFACTLLMPAASAALEQSFPLGGGFNFIALHVVPESLPTSAQLLETGKALAVFRFDRTSQSFVYHLKLDGGSLFGTAFSLQPGEGYVLRCAADPGPLAVTGPEYAGDPFADLAIGFNFIGLYAQRGAAARDRMDAVPTVTSIFRWLQGEQSFDFVLRLPDGSFFGKDFTIEAGKGYFVANKASAAKALTAFSFASPSAVGVIDEPAKTVAVTVPAGTNLTALVAVFSASRNATARIGATVQISGTTANDFSAPVVYTVTAEDGSTVSYTVTVTVSPSSGGDYLSPTIGALKFVPAGTFQRDGDPANLATVSAFRMGAHEITRQQFLAVMGVDPSDGSFSSGMNDPVQRTNWYHAIAFCNKLSLLEGLTPAYAVAGVDFATLSFAQIPGSTDATWNAATCDFAASGYRLPTDMEWMWAAMGADLDSQPGAMVEGVNRTGRTKPFAGSDGGNAIGNFAWWGTYVDEGSAAPNRRTDSVGNRAGNELSLFDMTGNAQEWCWDWHASMPAGPLTDYRGAATGSERVLHGGDWGDTTPLPVAYRNRYMPHGPYLSIGFRVARP